MVDEYRVKVIRESWKRTLDFERYKNEKKEFVRLLKQLSLNFSVGTRSMWKLSKLKRRYPAIICEMNAIYGGDYKQWWYKNVEERIEFVCTTEEERRIFKDVVEASVVEYVRFLRSHRVRPTAALVINRFSLDTIFKFGEHYIIHGEEILNIMVNEELLILDEDQGYRV